MTLAAAVLGSGLAAASPAAATGAPVGVITSAGPIERIGTTVDLNCDVKHVADAAGAFWQDTACGTFLAVGNRTYGPESVPSPTPTPAKNFPRPPASGYRAFGAVSQSGPAGSGTESDPLRVVTVVEAPGTNLTVTQVDTYVVGHDSYRSDVTVSNVGSSQVSAILYRAGDCFLGGDDAGFGALDPAGGSVGCVGSQLDASGTRVPTARTMMWHSLNPGSRAVEARTNDVWSTLVNRQPFPGTCVCDEYLDNAAGLSWNINVPGNGSVTRSHLLTFSSHTVEPLSMTKTADPAAVAQGGSVAYTIVVSNPNPFGVSLTSVSDELPPGFTYRSGTTTGAATVDPVVAGTSQLTWPGPILVPGGGSAALTFSATASSVPGDYFNRAAAVAAGNATVTPTGDTARVSVLGPASLTITADRATVAASPSSVPAADIPLQPRSPHIQTAPILQLPLLRVPILQLPLLRVPILQLPLLRVPILQLPLLRVPILQLPLLRVTFGMSSLVDPADLGSSPLVRAGLERIPLSTVRIVDGDDWHTRLGTNRPLQELTLWDAFTLVPDPARIPSLDELDLNDSPLGRLTSLSLFMGDTRLREIAFDWCPRLESLGYEDCGAALGVAGSPDKGRSASLVSLEIAGVNLDAVEGLKQIRMGEVSFGSSDRVALPHLLLSSFDLETASVGSVRIGAVPNPAAVVDCGIVVDCTPASTVTLHEAAAAGALREGARISDLGPATDDLFVVEVALGVYPTNDVHAFNLPPSQLGVLGYGGAGASEVHYQAVFNAPSALTGPEVSVSLPAGFRYIPGSATMQVDGVPLADPPEALAHDEVVRWEFGQRVLPPGAVLRVDVGARPGLSLGPANASATVRAGDFVLTGATASPLTVHDALETGDSVQSATQIESGRVYFPYMSHGGDVDYFTVPAPAQAGSRINVSLRCDCDADLVLYHPASARAHSPLRPPAPGPAIQADRDQPLGLAHHGEPLVPEAVEEVPIVGLPVAATSAARGTTPESVSVFTWDAEPGAAYTIQVSSYNGSTSMNAYGLRVTVTPPMAPPPAGAPRSFPNDGVPAAPPAAIPDFAGVKTLVLADRQRLRRAYGESRAAVALDALERLAAGSDLGVRLLFTDLLPEVTAAFAHLDAQPSDPERSNAVVRAINTSVDSLLGDHRSGLRNLVVVGTDEILPMSRLPDLTETGNERTFAQQLLGLAAASGGNNALLGSAAHGMILSDDPYGAWTPRPFLGTYLYIPDVAMGRLVETPEDMAAVIDGFLTPAQAGDEPGVLRPASSLVTGYDFLTKTAEAIRDALDHSVTPGEVATLIGEGWSRADIDAAFARATPPPDVVSPNAHYGPNALLPADGSQGLFTTDAFGGPLPPEIARRIIFQMGCHSGFSITNFLAAGGQAADWPETMLGLGVGAFVGNTGYGIGVPGTVAFSGRVVAGMADNLGAMSVGWAHTRAKQHYLSTEIPNVYSYKVSAESVYFGLPMFRIAGAPELPPPPAPGPPVVVDAATGLRVSNIAAVNPVGAGDNWELVTTGAGNYYQLRSQGLTTTVANRPIQPKAVVDVTQAGDVASGAWLTGLRSIDEDDFVPALARVVLANGEKESPLHFSSATFPAALLGVTSAGDRQHVVMIPGQYHGPNGTEKGRQRRFTRMEAQVFYQPPGSTDHHPPVFDLIGATWSGGIANFTAVVRDEGGGSVRDVAVLFRDGQNPQWSFRRLHPDGDGVYRGGFPTGDTVEYIIEAVDDSGNTKVRTNGGDYFHLSQAASEISVDVSIGSASSANGWYPDPTVLTLTGPEGTSFLVSDNGGPTTTWASGQPIPITGSGLHTIEWEVLGGGASGVVTLPIDGSTPVIAGEPLTASNEHGWYNGPVTVRFACSDAHAGVASCEPDRVLEHDGANQSVTGTVTDHVGNSATATVSGISIDTTPPSIWGSPTSAPNAAGWYTDPVTVRFQCEDELSGVLACPADQVVETNGADQSVTGTAIDHAGNAISYTVTGINVDRIAPTITPVVDGEPNSQGWYDGPVNVTFVCGDEGGAGLVACTSRHTFDTEGVGMMVIGMAVDGAGNTTTVTVGGINIDSTPPSIVAIVTPAQSDSTDWRRGPATVHFTCTDGLSGIATCPADVVLPSSGVHNVSRTASDNAGNSASVAVAVKVDASAPTSDFNGSGLVVALLGSPVHGSAQDAHSGVDRVTVTYRNNLTGTTQSRVASLSCNAGRTSCSWSATTPAALGVYTATVVAVDRVGNPQNPGAVRQVQIIG